MGRKLVVALGIGGLSLAIAACGGGGQPADSGSLPSAKEIIACLTDSGLSAEPLAVESEVEGVSAQAPDGDRILIINVPERGFSAAGSELLKKEARKRDEHRIITTTTVNEGLTLIGVLGVEGVGGGVASSSTEILARQCATKSQDGHAPTT